MFNKRISIFTGHFGSGKTEVAVNYTLQMSKRAEKTAIVDFDIVNPYFRTTDAKGKLESEGIWVVTPLYANTNVDVPALPSEVNTLFENREYKIVFDVGGDDLGAKVLSRYKNEIVQDSYQMLFVVNIKRPMTDTEEKIEEMIHSIESSSRLRIDGLVNNTNLLQDTSPEVVLEGYKVLKRISKKLNKPITFTSGLRNVMSEIKHKIDSNILFMDKTITLPWQ